MAKSKRAVTTKLRSEHISLQQNGQNAYQHSINRSVANYQKTHSQRLCKHSLPMLNAYNF